MTRELLLHIGGAKCGSSALQTALGLTPRLKGTDGRRWAYAAITKDGELIHGKELRQTAMARPRGYQSSMMALKFTPEQWRHMRQQLDQIPFENVILSNEGWRDVPASIRDNLLTAFGKPASAIIYVRPQVSLLNSGWWQWGAWEGVGFDEWLKGHLPTTHWARLIRNFSTVTGIKQVTIRVLPRDVVRDFLDFIHVDPGENDVRPPINKGLPAQILRLFQRHPEMLRPGPHASEIDFVLSRYLDVKGSTPWVMDRATIEHVIAHCREDNLGLLDMLEPEQQQLMRADEHWWSAEAYAGRKAEPWAAQPADAGELDELCALMAKTLFQLGRRRPAVPQPAR